MIDLIVRCIIDFVNNYGLKRGERVLIGKEKTVVLFVEGLMNFTVKMK